MSSRGRVAVSLVTALAMLLVSGPVRPADLFAAGEPPAAQYSQSLTVRPGSVNGQVLYPDGETPAANVPVRVWRMADKKFVYEGTTDGKGNYRVPALEPGQYVLVIGDRVRVEVIVSDAAPAEGKPLNVIIPRGKAFFSTGELEAELAGEEGGAEGGKLLRSLLILSAGAITAVGIVWAAGGFGDGDGKKVVSP